MLVFVFLSMQPNSRPCKPRGSLHICLAGYFAEGKIEGVTIKNSTIRGAKYTGGLLGKSYSNILDCRVEISEISTNTKEVGGLVGFYYNGKLSSCCWWS